MMLEMSETQDIIRREGIVKKSSSTEDFERLKIFSSRDAYDESQKKTFTKWVNATLIKESLEISDLFTDLADGKILIKLLETLSGEKLGRPNRGIIKVQKAENINKCLEFLKTKTCIENIGAEDIIDGNRSLILGLIWIIILRLHVNEIETPVADDKDSGEKRSATDALLLWCQSVTSRYPGVKITNFSNSWRNGLGFNALIHAHRPDLLDFEDLDPVDHIGNLNDAFDIAAEKLGIPKLLDAEDVDVSKPDEKVIITYLASYYHYFTNVKREMTKDVCQTSSKTQPPMSDNKESMDAIDGQALKNLEYHAIQVAKTDHSSVKDIIKDLIPKNVVDDLEICRLIYLWLATKDLNKMSFENVQPGSPEEVLMGVKAKRTTYAKVFNTMCTCAGLTSEVVRGYAKGFHYIPGQKFQQGSTENSWNAVQISRKWYLIDADWGARHINERNKTTEELVYKFDYYFFLTEPEQLIFFHFPHDAKWQLLDKPVTLEEFENMPYIFPTFFKYGLTFENDTNAVVYGRGEIVIRIKYPANRLALTFNYTIQFENKDEDFKGFSLNRYVMHETTGNVTSFRLRLPKKESYMLHIYANEDTPEELDKEFKKFKEVCQLKIVQEDVESSQQEPFPPCVALTWGLRAEFFNFRLTTDYQTATAKTQNGIAELQFTITKPMQFVVSLKNNKKNDSELEGYCSSRIVNKTAHFKVTAPGRGEYGLEIYANDLSTENTFVCVANYLIECNEDVDVPPLPNLPAGYLGAQAKFYEFGLNTISHHDPVILLETNLVEIKLSKEQTLKVASTLTDAETDKDFPDMVFIQTQGSVISFLVSLPAEGFYKLQLYSIPASDMSEGLHDVYNYLINCRKITQPSFPFPKQYETWKHECYMEAPLIIHAGSGDEVPFRVIVPKATAVAVVAGNDWTHLQSSKPSFWEGRVRLEGLYGMGATVTLNACYGVDSRSYTTLLKYDI